MFPALCKETSFNFLFFLKNTVQELPNLLSLMKTGRAISVADAYPRSGYILRTGENNK